MHRRRIMAMVVLAAVLASVPTVEAQLATYDAFTAATIDPEKWIGVEIAGTSNTEMFRRIVGGRAQLLLRTAGGTSSNSGSVGASNRFRIGHEALLTGDPRITQMQARVTVIDASVGTCPANATASVAVAQLFGVFFNDGTGTDQAGDRTGDVFAVLQKRINSAGERRLEASLLRCDDAFCSIEVVATTEFARSWANGEADVMRMRWDGANDRVVFTVNGPAGSETKSLTYTVDDAGAPKRVFNDFSASFAIANCAAGAVSGVMDMRIDNVRLNAAAVQVTQ